MALDLNTRNIALAIDGGGIKGLMVAKALVELEAKLGGGPLLHKTNLKVMSGTSTGAILTAAIALGMTAQDMVHMYTSLGSAVFPRWWSEQPAIIKWFASKWELALQVFFRPALFDNKALREILRQVGLKYGVATLGDIHQKLNNPENWVPDANGKYTLSPNRVDYGVQNERTLIITVVDINERRTRFLKSNDPKDANLKFEDVILASAAAPSYLPVITLPLEDKRTGMIVDTQCTDGGVGSHGNPAYIAALEILQYAKQPDPPNTVSVLSFGTGFLPAKDYELDKGHPRDWRLIKWAQNIPIIMIGDAARWQSVDIILKAGGVDFRRYQVPMEKDIGLDDASRPALDVLENVYGERMAERVKEDNFAPNASSDYDPEGLFYMVNSTLKQLTAKG
ncbi:MAG: patatin-like phospholipase family protein [Anaerolineae bacterium]|nr:patatin-like phospholipase family protein [Anaerolineae bacterium]